MIPNKHPHTGPPGRLVTWGSPWHGPHQQGEVTLPTGAKMALPQADQGASGGDVLVFRPPGTVLPPRPPEWLAADAEAGREWRDYALITGRNNRCLYGKSLGKGHGCWLYAAPDGSRWLVSIGSMVGGPASVDFTAAWNITITATRFGDIAVGTGEVGEWSTAPPAAQETHSTGATLTDWQQAIPGKSGGDYSIDTLGSITTGLVWLEDASITGAHAVLMAGLDYPDEAIKRRSLGFVEVSLTGTPGIDWTASLSVLRTRLQTLGTFVDTEDRTTGAQEVWVKYRSDPSQRLDDSAAGTPPTCDGTFWNTKTATSPVAVSGYPGVSGAGYLRTYTGVMTFSRGFAGRIVAMAYYGSSEAAGEIKLDAKTDGVITMGPLTSKASGETVWANASSWDTISPQCEVGQVSPPIRYYTDIASQTITCKADSQVTLTMPDGSIMTSPLSASVVGGYDMIYNDADYTDSTVVSAATVTMNAGSRTVSFNERHVNGAPKDYWTPAGNRVGWTNGDHAYLFNSQLATVVPALNSSLSLVAAQNDGFFADRLYLVPNPPGTFSSASHGLSYFKTQLRRYSNKLWEFESVEFFRLADGTDQPIRTIQMGAAGTGGSKMATVMTDEGDPVPAYGSHNPVTGEIKRAQALPVVYI